MAELDQIVIFGATGDLTGRKLVPALLRNVAAGALQRPIQVIGVSRSERSHEAWRGSVAEQLPEALREPFGTLAPHLHYVSADASEPAQIHRLHNELDRLAGQAGGDPEKVGRLFYLALAPHLFGPTVAALASEGLVQCEPGTRVGWRRVVVEKPFGRDLASARALNRELLTHLREDQLFRIDHYLGKETVQNLLSFRFQNAIFEPLWNRRHIESVEISVCETVAMEGQRGAYYDTAGAMRDMVQNHLLQVLALVAMEPPGAFDADDVRNEKLKVFRALRRFTPEEARTNALRAQYVAGPARDRGYREEPGVAPDSTTETYVAIRAAIDNWRWSGVPFLLRTGKALHKRFTEVVLNFRVPPVDLLNGPDRTTTEGLARFSGIQPVGGFNPVCALRPNALRIHIQPDEGFTLSFLVKEPGAGMNMRPAEFSFDYASLGVAEIPDAYQRLLLDALEGNATLFLRGDEVEAAWAFADAIREGWEASDAPVLEYEAGSQGPEASQALWQGCEGTWSVGP